MVYSISCIRYLVYDSVIELLCYCPDFKNWAASAVLVAINFKNKAAVTRLSDQGITTIGPVATKVEVLTFSDICWSQSIKVLQSSIGGSRFFVFSEFFRTSRYLLGIDE